MANICEYCGKKIGFLDEPYYLTEGKTLCLKCAQKIQDDIYLLNSAKSIEEYQTIKYNTLKKSRELFNDTITKYVSIAMDEKYKKINPSFEVNTSFDIDTFLNYIEHEINPAIKKEQQNIDIQKTKDYKTNNINMFNNVGKKIKLLAKAICWIGIIVSIIAAIVMFIVSDGGWYVGFVFAGVIILVVGPLLSWIGSFFMYGFGELIDKICDIEINTRN